MNIRRELLPGIDAFTINDGNIVVFTRQMAGNLPANLPCPTYDNLHGRAFLIFKGQSMPDTRLDVNLRLHMGHPRTAFA